jgi:hypothetical protein
MAAAAGGAYETRNDPDLVPELIDDSTDLSDSDDIVIRPPFQLDGFQRKRAGLLIKALCDHNVTYAVDLGKSIVKLLESGSLGLVTGNLVDRFAVMICDYLMFPAKGPLPLGSMKMIANSIANMVLQWTSNNPPSPISNDGTALQGIKQLRDARFPAAIRELITGWMGWETSLSVNRNPRYSIEGQETMAGPFTAEEFMHYTLHNVPPDSYYERMQEGHDGD